MRGRFRSPRAVPPRARRGRGGDEHVEALLEVMPGGADGALLFVMALIFLLGCFLDFVEISVILLPLVVPSLIIMGHDPVWLSILIAVNLQTKIGRAHV